VDQNKNWFLIFVLFESWGQVKDVRKGSRCGKTARTVPEKFVAGAGDYKKKFAAVTGNFKKD
jgi:hypothetical protein